jgi:hypothetical protein
LGAPAGSKLQSEDRFSGAIRPGARRLRRITAMNPKQTNTLNAGCVILLPGGLSGRNQAKTEEGQGLSGRSAAKTYEGEPNN